MEAVVSVRIVPIRNSIVSVEETSPRDAPPYFGSSTGPPAACQSEYPPVIAVTSL